MAHAKLPIFFLFFLVLALSSSELFTLGFGEIDDQPVPNMVPLTIAQTMNQMYFFPKGGMRRKSRKLLEDSLVQPDYDYAGANPRHDPRRGRGGGRNP